MSANMKKLSANIIYSFNFQFRHSGVSVRLILSAIEFNLVNIANFKDKIDIYLFFRLQSYVSEIEIAGRPPYRV